jgi:glycerol-3-phosphate dehydrogenase subunit C
MSHDGSLDAPTRHIIDWQNPDFADPVKLDEEMRRVFDICHGCRRCFNLCDSFPRLFDLIDTSPTEELSDVKSADFEPVVEACTLCDMCFMTKCPYVPPHPFQLDFPHLMLRHRFANQGNNKNEFVQKQLAEMDRNGTLARVASPVINWASDKSNTPVRVVMEKVAGIDRAANLPKFNSRTFISADKAEPLSPNEAAPAYGKRKAALYATCFVNYNKPVTGLAARAVLNHIGVETKAAYPGCCGMPFLEQAELSRVAANAAKVSKELVKLIDEGYDIVALTASCGLMLKFEWALIPDTPVDIIERCSGHGGTFGVVKPTHEVAVKVGRPVFRAAEKQARGHIVSDCPLAAQHIFDHSQTPAKAPEHPIQIMAIAFGLES